MGKILAFVFLIAFIWYAGPVIKQGVWYSPTLYPEYWWGEPTYDYSQEIAQDGGGWFNIDPRKGSQQGRTTASVFEAF